MLTQLTIHNFRLIDTLDLIIPDQLCVVTGETGAGKSILIDALSLLMGHRADINDIRTGCASADLLAIYHTAHYPEIDKWLTEQSLNNERECIIRRVINRDGRSRSYINGRPVPLSAVKQISEQLISIHGQHQSHMLRQKEFQRLLLDQFAGNASHLHLVAQLYKQLQNGKKRLSELEQAHQQRAAHIELLNYQVDELRALNIEENEFANLEQQHQQLANATQLQQIGGQIREQLDQHAESNIVDQLNHANSKLSELASKHQTVVEISDMLQQATIIVSEASKSFENYLSDIEDDPATLNQIEHRMTTLHEAARKHKVPPHELHDRLLTLENELAALNADTEDKLKLEKELSVIAKKLSSAAEQLSQARKDAIPKLEQAVTLQINQLGLPHGRFSINLEPSETVTAHGAEQIEFMITTNPGLPAGPIKKVASGGELSRISLAIQVICSTHTTTPPTIVFDEVDVGVGGAVAEVVGKLLRQLGTQGQVICITHLPQVAAQGHAHIHVSKIQQNNMTTTEVKQLSQEETLLEIARMLGGIEISEHTIAHAQEMLDSCEVT